MTEHWQHLDPRYAQRRGPEWVLALRCVQTPGDLGSLLRCGCEAFVEAQLGQSPRLLQVEAAALAGSVAVFLALGGAPKVADGVHPDALAAVRNAPQVVSRDFVRTPRPDPALLAARQADIEATATTVPGLITLPTTTSTSTSPPTTAVPRPVVTNPPAKSPSSGNVQVGGASFYDFKAGGCAHRTLPKGTVITVTNLANGKSATCVVNDRGPFISGRIIDLDRSVFTRVASVSSGVFNARITW